MTGFNPTPRYWLQLVPYDGTTSYVGTAKTGRDVLRQARALLRSQSGVEYIIVLDGNCCRTDPRRSDIVADVQREQVPGSQPLLTPSSGAKKRERRQRRNEHYRREEWN